MLKIYLKNIISAKKNILKMSNLILYGTAQLKFD